MNSSYKFCLCLWVFGWSYAKEQWRNPETIIPAVLYLFLHRSLWSGGLSWDWTLLCQTLVDSTSLSTILQEESSASLQFYCQDIVEVCKERCYIVGLGYGRESPERKGEASGSQKSQVNERSSTFPRRNKALPKESFIKLFTLSHI